LTARLQPLGEAAIAHYIPAGDELGDLADANILRNGVRKDGTYGFGERSFDAS